MRIIGLDLAITSTHKAVVMDETGKFLTPVFSVATWPQDLAAMVRRARQGAAADLPLVVVMEPTGLAWLPVAVYLLLQQVTVYLVNSQQVADLRRYYKRHAKSDRIDARVLAKLPLVSPGKLHLLVLPSADLFTLQRACKQVDWLITHLTALRNQIVALDRMVGLGGWEDIFDDPFSPAARWCREHYYDPFTVLKAGTQTIRQEWRASQLDSPDCLICMYGRSQPNTVSLHWLNKRLTTVHKAHDVPSAYNQDSQGLDSTDLGAWAKSLVALAQPVVAIYGSPALHVDFAALQAEVSVKQKWMAQFEADRDHWRLEVVRPLYRRLHPSRNLETLKGVGQDSAAVFLSTPRSQPARTGISQVGQDSAAVFLRACKTITSDFRSEPEDHWAQG
jgi:hypothetical protein